MSIGIMRTQNKAVAMAPVEMQVVTLFESSGFVKALKKNYFN